MADTQSTSTGRLEAFSDGVFAIAITLLILDLRVPRVEPDKNLGLELLKLWPNFIAYLMSFGVILVIWVNHHRVFTMIRRTDQAFLFWNGLLLMFVTIVPFPTALLAEYMWHGDPVQFRIAALVYAGNGAFISMTFHVLWRHATRNGRLLPTDYDPDQIKQVNDEYRWAPAAYLAIFGIAFVAPWVSIGLCFVFVMLFSVQGLMNWRPRRRRA